MSKPDTWKAWEGRIVEGKFPLRQWLGGSDHSAVFLTEMPGQPARNAAIKFIPVDNGNGEAQLSRLRAASRLSHHHLVRMFEAGSTRMDGGTVLYVVMECADDDLSQILPERALQPGEVADLLPPVLDALLYLHKNGFVHGRVKPSNVLAAGDQLKLSSDQVSSAAQQDGRRRRRDVYDAPETAAGIITPAGDVWSMGVTLIAALTQDVTLAEAASPENRDLPESIPEPFREIARDCLRLDPKGRGSLKDIQARLQPAARSVPAPLEPPPVEPAKNRGKLGAMAIVVVALVAIGLTVAYFRSNRPAPQSSNVTNPVVESAPGPATTPTPTPAPAPAPAMPQTTEGVVVRQVLPDIPKTAMNTISGTIKVAVRVQVDTSGKVSSATYKMAGHGQYFANHAVQAAKQWEFSAPKSNGQPQPSSWLLQFRFKRSGIQVSPQRVKR
jgi:TonB family protein